MPGRINHLAVFVAAIVYFLWGGLWYGLLFKSAWSALAGHVFSAPIPPQTPILMGSSFVLGWILAYGTAMALSRRPEDQTVQQGVSFAIFMSIFLYGTMTYQMRLYEGIPIGLWAIDYSYVLIGFAVVGAIVGGWKSKAPA